jgi:hypothetical protein
LRYSTGNQTNARQRHALGKLIDSGAPMYEDPATSARVLSLDRRTVFRAALREGPDSVRGWRLVDVLDPATLLLEAVDPSEARSALLALRQLVDAPAAGEAP